MAPPEDSTPTIAVVSVEDVRVEVAADSAAERRRPSKLVVDDENENDGQPPVQLEDRGRISETSSSSATSSSPVGGGGGGGEGPHGRDGAAAQVFGARQTPRREPSARSVSESMAPLRKSRFSFGGATEQRRTTWQQREGEEPSSLSCNRSGSNLEPFGPRDPRDDECNRSRARPAPTEAASSSSYSGFPPLHAGRGGLGRASGRSSTPGLSQEDHHMARLLRSARFVPLIALKHAAEAHAVNPTEGERVVEAVVVFADVSGYTTLAEACNKGAGGAAQGLHANLVGSTSTGLAGAERMRDALNEYLGNMIDMLTEYGADIVKFAGDAVMAVWEVNKRGMSSTLSAAAAETAARATAVCLKMGAALDKYTCQGIPKGCNLRLHTAIGYGSLSLVFVGGVDGHWLQLPVGDPITQVAPILDAAAPGTLVVSHETYELLRGTFECKPLTTVAAKNGKQAMKKRGGGDGGDGGDGGEQSPGNDAAEEKAEEVIGMQVLRRSDDFPKPLAHYIDAGFDQINDVMQKKAKKKEMARARRSSLIVDNRETTYDTLYDSYEQSPTHHHGNGDNSAGSGGGGSHWAETPDSARCMGGGRRQSWTADMTSPVGDGRDLNISGGRAYRKRVEDIFKTARTRTSTMSRHIPLLPGTGGLTVNTQQESASISAAHYDAVLSFIPLPSRVALTGSIAELRRVTVMFITLDSPAALHELREKRVNREGAAGGHNSSSQSRRRSSRNSSSTSSLSPLFAGSSGGSAQLQQLQHVACTMQREVVRHDGFVKELTMDDKGLVMVVGFGVPPCCRWAQDPVLGACEAALAIKAGLKTYGQRCGIGITTGDVFCGTIGNSKRCEYSMIGSVVNLAARFMGAAAKLQKGIFIDHATKEVAVRDGLMECKFHDELKVKGKSELVPVWRLKSTRLKRVSRVSFDADENPKDSMMDTLKNTVLNKEDEDDNETAKHSRSVRRLSYLYDTYDDSDDEGDGALKDDEAGIVGREQELGTIRDVMAAAAEADGIVDAKTKNQGKGRGDTSSKGDGGSRGVLSALFGSCLGGGGGGGGGADASRRRGSAREGEGGGDGGGGGGGDHKFGDKKSGKLVLIEGEAGIGKTCLLKEVERSAGLESGFWCFRTNFATRQEVNFGWWYILRQMQREMGEEQNTLLTHSQRSRLTLLLEVGDMMSEMEKDMGSMGEKGIAIQRELTHALLMLMDVMTTAGAPGIMLILDDAAHLDAVGMDTVRYLLQPPPGFYPYTEAPFFPAVPNLVVVMALRPVPHASPTFKTHYSALRELADEHIVLSGLSRQQLGDQLLKSRELRKMKGVDRIDHTALCFLHERSSGNFKQAMAWMIEFLDVDAVQHDGGLGSRQSSQRSDLCYRNDHDANVDRNKNEAAEEDHNPSRFCLRVVDSAAPTTSMKRRGSTDLMIGRRGSLDSFPLTKINSGKMSGVMKDDHRHRLELEMLDAMERLDTLGSSGATSRMELRLEIRQAMQACVRIPTDVRAMYTAVNDSLSPSEILALRVCSVLGEITPETMVYAQPGGWADYIQSATGVEMVLDREGEMSDLNGEVPDLKKTLKKLVERGFLVHRTRGSVLTRGNERVPGVVTRDSLDGTTAVLSHHVTKMCDMHPVLDGKGVDDFLFSTIEEGQRNGGGGGDGDTATTTTSQDMKDPTELLTFTSFVHQEVTFQGWGLEHRRKVHDRMCDVATQIMRDLRGRMAEMKSASRNPPMLDETGTGMGNSSPLSPEEPVPDATTTLYDKTETNSSLVASKSSKVSRQKTVLRQVFRSGNSEKSIATMTNNIKSLLTATHMWRIHHTMMSEDFVAAKAAWKAAHDDLGSMDALRMVCRQKVLNVFSNVPGHMSIMEEGTQSSRGWAILHVVLLPWLRGVAQMFQLESRRRWDLVRTHVAWLRVSYRERHQRMKERLAAVEHNWGSGMSPPAPPLE